MSESWSTVDPAVAAGPVPAGWFPDPDGRHELRWWDPPRWTDDVCDAGVRSTDPVATASPHDAAVPVAAGTHILEAEAFSVAMPDVGAGTWQTTLPVVGADDGRPLGSVHFSKARMSARSTAVSAFLVDLSGATVIGARRSTSVSSVGGGEAGPLSTSTGERLELLDGSGTVMTTSRHSQVMDRHRIRFSHQGVEALQLELRHGRRHQVGPTTISVGGVGLGSVVQLGERATRGPAGSWLRLDRAPALGEPHRTFVAAAPLVLLTSIT